MKLKALAVSIGLALALGIPATAQASSDQNSTILSPGCYKWHFREFRDGLFVSGLLWQITQTVTWCSYDGKHFSWTPHHSHGHKEGSSWNFGGWDEVSVRHLHSPNRYVYRIAATEVGNASGVFNEHNYPYQRLTIFPDFVSDGWAASCGCKGTLTKVKR
jgi:hypothetical protein